MGKKSFNFSGNKSFVNKEMIKNNVSTLISKPVYESKINYTELNVTDNEKEQLINYEQVIINKQAAISVSLMEMSTALYNAQQILSREKVGDGTFIKWFEQLKLSKSFVYRCLDKYKLYLISNMETVMDLTVKETSMITKALKENTIKEAEIIDIIKSDNITKILDEKINGPEEPMIIDLSLFKTKSEQDKLIEYKQTKKDLKGMSEELFRKKQKMKELKEEILELTEHIKMMKENIKNMKIEIDNNKK